MQLIDVFYYDYIAFGYASAMDGFLVAHCLAFLINIAFWPVFLPIITVLPLSLSKYAFFFPSNTVQTETL
jgi:hypothetical protein